MRTVKSVTNYQYNYVNSSPWSFDVVPLYWRPNAWAHMWDTTMRPAYSILSMLEARHA